VGTIAIRGEGATAVAPASSVVTWDGEGEMKTIDIRKLPELATKVGIHGSARQQEVGGVFCAGVVIVVSSG
jgi:hypothetical protein